MAARIGINGFGRTGRTLFRAAARADLELEVVAVNDLASPELLAGLLARDSVYGRYGLPVRVEADRMVVGDHQVRMLAEPEMKALPWEELGVDVVVEATGRFTERDSAAGHLDAGLTMTRGAVVKVFGWYDNEWGYANRLAELAAKVGGAPHP